MPADVLDRPRPAMPLDGARFDDMVLDYAVAAMAVAQDAFGNLNAAILFAATARSCGPFDQTPGRRRPVSINALATSLNRPFETIRRHANALVAQGLVTRTPDGLSVGFAAMADPRVARLVDRCHDLLVALVEDACAAGFALPAAHADRAYDPRSGIGIALDLLLAAAESHGGRAANFTRLGLLLTVEWAARQRDPRGAMRISRIARLLDLPYATATRNLEALVAQGQIARQADGVAARADAPGAAVARAALANRARQLIGRLVQNGFPVDAPGCAYIQARPAPLRLR